MWTVLRCAALLTFLGLSTAHAQSEAPSPLSDAERVRRDASKVFSFIKQQAAKRVEPTRVAEPRTASAPAEAPVQRKTLKAGVSQQLRLAADEAEGLEAPAAAAELSGGLATAPQALAIEAEAAEPRLIEFVQPELSPALQASLGGRAPRVVLTLLIQPSGKVELARAEGGVPRRIAQVAERAAQQWRFEPGSGQREVQVEVLFQL
ncbi:hypothetical protein HNQ51_002096 [Inhella inkyongensis]|uniref:TonB C-terminal domain-containing protein n=1 Tax=Inhella inkyongensis TaxID=392593 RepID=A0A840S5D3_9BURK|nr:hypothetical protein [Inhella inkyongensis]MBB5204782.1 hypothetical protein [Inhella inkyongensis]